MRQLTVVCASANVTAPLSRNLGVRPASFNNNFNWIGVKTVKVFSRDLATLNDYTVGGSNRYKVKEYSPLVRELMDPSTTPKA